MRPVVAAILFAALFVPACQTAPNRYPVESGTINDDFAAAKIAEIVVLPVDSHGLQSKDVNEGQAFPKDAMRQMVRKYLVGTKSYAVPASAWVDDAMKNGATSSMETDAILEVRMEQWDTKFLAGRGVVYAGAAFQLKSARDNATLWTYRCTDRQIPVAGPLGASAIAANMRAAARRLTEDALSRLPRKNH